MTTASTAESFKVEHVKYDKGKTENFQGYTYTGEFENGKKHGKGTKIYDQTKGVMETKFVGIFKDGRMDGEGIMYRKDGSWQEGYFIDDKLQGKGKHHTPEGNIIIGEFYNGAPDGEMKIKYISGTKFNKETNKREITFEKGEEYEGFMLNWKQHGEGLLKIPKQNAEISGEWYHGTLSHGQKYWQKKDCVWIYDGPLKSDRIMEGEGVCEIKLNSASEVHVIEGLFKNDKLPIYGYKTIKNSATNDGFYHGALDPENGHRSGKGSFHYENLSKGYYIGHFKKDLKHGYG